MRRVGFGAMAPISLVAGIVLFAIGLISAQALDYIAMFSVWWVVWQLLRRSRPGPIAPLTACGVVACLIAVQNWASDLRYMPYLLIIPANLTMAWMFARGVLFKREAILVSLIVIMGMRPIEPKFRRFVERQCLLWSVMCLGMAALSFLAVVWPAERVALGVVLSILVAAQVLWFAVSHYYAAIMYHRPETWWCTLQTMIRPDVWVRLGVR